MWGPRPIAKLVDHYNFTFGFLVVITKKHSVWGPRTVAKWGKTIISWLINPVDLSSISPTDWRLQQVKNQLSYHKSAIFHVLLLNSHKSYWKKRGRTWHHFGAGRSGRSWGFMITPRTRTRGHSGNTGIMGIWMWVKMEDLGTTDVSLV